MTVNTITQTILTATDGNYLTNGETYGKTVVLPVSEDISKWREISEKEYNDIMAEIEHKVESI